MKEIWVAGELYTIKKVFRYSCPQPGCHLPNSPRAGTIELFLPRGCLVSDIPAGDGNITNLFYSARPHPPWLIFRLFPFQMLTKIRMQRGVSASKQPKMYISGRLHIPTIHQSPSIAQQRVSPKGHLLRSTLMVSAYGPTLGTPGSNLGTKQPSGVKP